MGLEGNAETNELKGKVVKIPEIDDTLTKEGYAADSKAVGDKIKEIQDGLNANGTSYDNTKSDLNAETVQDAIDEVNEKAFDKNTGGMVNGSVQVRNADNGYGEFGKNNSDTADYGTQMVDVSKDGKTAKISVSALLGTLAYTGPDGKVNNMIHEGNKAFSNYTGNGNARTVATGGIGRLLLVYCDDYVALVTPKGSFVAHMSGGAITWVSGSVAYYLNGNLIISSAHAAFNVADVTYYYQVI